MVYVSDIQVKTTAPAQTRPAMHIHNGSEILIPELGVQNQSEWRSGHAET
jgi:hypothetical protein